jgi:hypothetical protein
LINTFEQAALTGCGNHGVFGKVDEWTHDGNPGLFKNIHAFECSMKKRNRLDNDRRRAIEALTQTKAPVHFPRVHDTIVQKLGPK